MKGSESVLLSVRNLCIYFGESGRYLKAVEHVSLEVGKGEIVGLIGESGSGKTTTVLGLLGLVRGAPGVWKGEAHLEEKSLLPVNKDFVQIDKEIIQKRYRPYLQAHRHQLRSVLGREINVIFQEPKASLDPFFTVGEHLIEALDRHPEVVQGSPKETGLNLLKDVGLVDAENLWGLYPHQISGGMAQRVMISIALCARPKLLIADEPTTSLDVTTQARLLQLFTRLRDKHGLSIILISHDIGVIQEVCERLYVMHRGTVVETGRTAELLQSPKHPYTALLLHSFARFGQKQLEPPTNPDGGVGCAYRNLCAAYAQSLNEVDKVKCQNHKPPTQKNGAPAGEPWSKCHYPHLTKETREEKITAGGLANREGVAAPNKDLVVIHKLNKVFTQRKRTFHALHEVTLAIPEGQTYGLVGESGSGKSTLALALMALQMPDSGEVHFRGENILAFSSSKMRHLRQEFRMLFQHPEAVLNSGMTVERILREGLERFSNMTEKEKMMRVEEVLGQVRLDKTLLRRHPGNLSSGEKQRVTIARALITKPAFLVCDEPVASLDLSIQSQVMGLLKDFQDQFGLTYLFISHNLPLVKILAHRIGVMYMGYLVEEADASAFSVHQVKHPYSKLLLASAPRLESEDMGELLETYPDVEPVRLEGGCPFRNRCPLYLKHKDLRCEKEMPPLIERGQYRVACHLAV